jgi:hypothetical protein
LDPWAKYHNRRFDQALGEVGPELVFFFGIVDEKEAIFVFATIALISGSTLGSKVVTENAVGLLPKAYG